MYIKIYKEACPICDGHVKGNFSYKYHCEACMILFDYKDLKKPLVEHEVVTDHPTIRKRLNKKV
ncbi:hypothetical protein K9L67_04525 [Candidatus Woesearchaeota archaeon]|nr:hypothetical protein [Candidatus Woesearchaeota archaeon]MCF7901465.1 hypothetical protein [Candidatus Woesearchaeota archaeon]MCF8013550.1 hypothetical protein [Candidatus Woesearchaeota archaeon]